MILLRPLALLAALVALTVAVAGPTLRHVAGMLVAGGLVALVGIVGRYWLQGESRSAPPAITLPPDRGRWGRLLQLQRRAGDPGTDGPPSPSANDNPRDAA